MPGHQNSPPSASLRSNIANVAAPAKLRCTLCKKYKAQAAFSNKEINEWKYLHGKTGDAEAAGGRIRCRTCAGSPKMEMTCSSCHITQVIEHFSKTQRSQAGSRCRDCVSWFDNTEPGVTPFAAPETESSPDEEYIEAIRGYGSFGLDDLNLEGEPDSDEENDILHRKDELLSIGDSTRTVSYASSYGRFSSKARTETIRSYNTESSLSNPYDSSGRPPVSREPSIPSWSTPTGVNSRNDLHTRQQSMISSQTSGAHGLISARVPAQAPAQTPAQAPAPKIEYTKHGWPKKVNQIKPKAPKPEFYINRDQPKSMLQTGIPDDDDSEDSM